MKLFIAFIFLLFPLLNIFSQNVEDLNKKELKDLYLKTNLKVDSLSLINLNQIKVIDNLFSQKNELSSKNIQLENKISEQEKLIIGLKKLKNEFDQNEEKYKKQISLLNDSIQRLSAIRDISNGIFTTEEIDFITKTLSVEIKSFSDNQNDPVRVAKTGDKVAILLGKGEVGYIPSIEFHSNYEPKFAGDFDKDGKSEIIFSADVSGGGLHQWGQIYCLKVLPNNEYKLYQIEVDCPCLKDYSCGDNPYPELSYINNDMFLLHFSCFAEFDANCCPSSEITGEYIFKTDKLLLKK